MPFVPARSRSRVRRRRSTRRALARRSAAAARSARGRSLPARRADALDRRRGRVSRPETSSPKTCCGCTCSSPDRWGSRAGSITYDSRRGAAARCRTRCCRSTRSCGTASGPGTPSSSIPAGSSASILPNRAMGRPLHRGRHASRSSCKKDWLDARGVPLTSEFRREYRVGAADERALDTAEWRVAPPPAGARDPLTVTFPAPLDHGLLQRALGVSRAGAAVPGELRIEDGATRWRFVPRDPWQAGDYTLVVLPILEDVPATASAARSRCCRRARRRLRKQGADRVAVSDRSQRRALPPRTQS